MNCEYGGCRRPAQPGQYYCGPTHRDVAYSEANTIARHRNEPAVFSLPHNAGAEIRRTQVPGRAALEADRRTAPTPPRTLSVREGYAALADQPLSPEDSERLNRERETDMYIRAAGLTPHGGEVEYRRNDLTPY
jgi:hypothetical protein